MADKTKIINPEGGNGLMRFIRKHPVLTNFIAICAVFFVLIVIIFWFFSIFTHHGSTAEVPDVRNMSYAAAANVIEGKGLQIEINDSVYDEALPPGTVKEVWPSVGSIVKPGRTIFVTITSFQPRMVSIREPLTGDVSSRQAIATLARHNLRNVRIEYADGPYNDLVQHVYYNGREVTPDMQIPMNGIITLVVSRGNFTIDDEVQAINDSIQNNADNGNNVGNVNSADTPVHAVSDPEPDDEGNNFFN